jgi:hypothetical protein
MEKVMWYRFGVFVACILTTIAIADAANSVSPNSWNGLHPGMSMQEAAELIRHYRWPDSIQFARDSSDLDPKKPLFIVAGVTIERKPAIYSPDAQHNAVEGVSPAAKGTAVVQDLELSFKPAENMKMKAYVESLMSLTCQMVQVEPGNWAEACQHLEGPLYVRLYLYSDPAQRSNVLWRAN